MPRADFVCAPRLRVRWAEVDMQKIVFNGHYLTYIDTAIAEYWREIGLPYPHGYVERYASDVFLRKATVEYLGSAELGDPAADFQHVVGARRAEGPDGFPGQPPLEHPGPAPAPRALPGRSPVPAHRGPSPA